MDQVSDSPITVDLGRIAQDLQIRRIQVETVVQLLDDGYAAPFIARYSRERTGGMPEGLIREIHSRVARARDLAARKQAILKTIESQGRLTKDLETAIRSTENSRKLDDLYLPYKPRKRTKGIEAREQGLEPLALRIWDRDETLTDLTAAAAELVNPEKGLDTPEKVLDGVRQILAESIGDLAHVRDTLRRTVWKQGRLATSKADAVPDGKGLDYRDYFQYSEPVGHVPAHRTLAINRGEKEGVLKVKLEVPRAETERVVLSQLPLEDHPHKEIFTAATLDSVERILLPALEREVKRELAEVAERHAVAVFARNLRSLLLQPPISDKVVLAIDPGRKGCKLAVLDGEGRLLEHAVVHPFPVPIRRYEAKQKIKDMVAAHKVELVAIGNGTACREIEELIAELIAEGSHFHNNPGEPFPGAPAPVVKTEETAAEADTSTSAKKEPEDRTISAEPPGDASVNQPNGTESIIAESIASSEEAPAATVESTAAEEQATSTADSDNLQASDAVTEKAVNEEEVPATPAPSSIDPENLPPITGGSGQDEQPDPEIEPGGGKEEEEAPPVVLSPSLEPTPKDTFPAPAAVVPPGESEVGPLVEVYSVPVYEPPSEIVHAAIANAEGAQHEVVIDTAHTVIEGGTPSDVSAELVSGPTETTSISDGDPPLETTPAAAIGARTPPPRVAPALTQPPKGSTKPKIKVEREPRPPKPKTPPPPPSPHAADPLLASLAYLIVNEAGANIYSSSSLAKEELPEYDAELRGTISIGRRLQDPLAELVKVDPQNIGVGQYQHDVNPKHLKESLDQVVESCVNFVGVDANRAGVTLLARVSGLNELLARRIVEYRKEHGPFNSREALKQVEGISDEVWNQAAGFLKVRESENPLDRTWVHPSQYEHAVRLLETLELTPAALLESESLATVHAKFNELDVPTKAQELGLAPPALVEIMEALAQAERDPREDSPQPIFKRGLLKLEDLESGTELKGTVLNVVDFGAFVDIGLKDSGLVHISQLANRYVKSPHDVVSVGDVVTVWVMTVDKDRKRVSLTMIQPGTERPRAERGPRGGGAEGGGPGGGRRGPRPPRRTESGGGQAGAGASGRGPSAEVGQQGGATAAPRPGTGRIPGPPLRMQQGRGGRPGQRGGMGRGGPGGRPQGGGGPRPDAGSAAETSASATPKPKPKPIGPTPLPSDAVTGGSPLRSFGQLKQLFELRQKGPEDGESEATATGPNNSSSPPDSPQKDSATPASAEDASQQPTDENSSA